jgi:light-regulated signal transduction histidine kinase (bacteriophytochrome)
MNLSISDRLKSNIPVIMSQWQDRALKQIASVRQMDVLVLRDSIPEYLMQLASALSTTIDRTAARIIFDKEASARTGHKHGQTRSESFNYTIDQLIFEYHILRQVIFEVLEKESPISQTEREVIICSIEQAVNDAATEFSNRLNGQTLELKTALMELDAFSYSVSHDLRAPLRSMDGFSELLLEKHADVLDEEAKGYLERIRSNSQKMAQLIDDLLILSRVGRAELIREKVDVSFIANHIIKRMKRLEPTRVVESNVSEHCTALADLGLMRIVLENLISNAWKYTSKIESAKISVGCESSAEGTVYFVKDNGIGFEMIHADQLFKAFHRLHSVKEYPGTGIGLATVKRIIDSHGGRVWVDSGPGKGSTFKFTLGIANDE